MGKKANPTEEKVAWIDEYFAVNRMVIDAKLALYEEQTKENPNPDRLRLLETKVNAWVWTYDQLMGGDKSAKKGKAKRI